MILFRTETGNEGTFGVLVYPDGYLFTAEPPDRGNRPNLSCIPAGRYVVSMRHSPKYGKVYTVNNVSKRSHILLHHGNFAGDRTLGFRTHSAGCIILGSRKGKLHGQNAVLNSRTARRKFELAMNWEDFELEIVNA